MLGGKNILSSCFEDMEKEWNLRNSQICHSLVDKVFFLKFFNSYEVNSFKPYWGETVSLSVGYSLSFSCWGNKWIIKKMNPRQNMGLHGSESAYILIIYLANSMTIIFFIKYYKFHICLHSFLYSSHSFNKCETTYHMPRLGTYSDLYFKCLWQHLTYKYYDYH